MSSKLTARGTLLSLLGCAIMLWVDIFHSPIQYILDSLNTSKYDPFRAAEIIKKIRPWLVGGLSLVLFGTALQFIGNLKKNK